MPLLQVRECPEATYKKVALIAKSQNRTIAQQVVVVLKKIPGQEESNAVLMTDDEPLAKICKKLKIEVCK